MRLARIATGLGRLLVAAFCLLSSIYALLAYIPFTYQQVHKGGLIPALVVFGHIHAQLYWAALAIACATILPELRRAGTRPLAAAFVAVHSIAGVLLQFFPVMANLRNDASSYAWALVALVPLPWLAAIDAVGYARAVEWAPYRREDDRRIFRAAWHTAVFLAVVYCAIFHLRASVSWGIAERVSALLITVLCHLLVFGVLFAAFNLVRSAAGMPPWPAQVEFVAVNVLGGGVLYSILQTLVFHPLSFTGAMAAGYAVMVALSRPAVVAGLGLRFWTPGRGPADGLGLALAPLTLPRFSRPFPQLLPLLGLAAVAWLLAVNIAIMDWNFMFQKLTASAVWLISFAYLYAIAPLYPDQPDRRTTVLFWTAMIMSAYRLTAADVAARPRIGTALERYAGYDASFRLIRDALSSPPRNDAFYDLLAKNTNIPRSVPTAPVDVDPAGKLTPGTGQKPNIFILVVDSLRRDYVGAYNRGVNFTPAIDAFARQSVVFRNSFTRYGGTGLAEPSIWVGGMLLHKQYVTPFYPMNALAKLVETEGYQSYISMDTILKVIVKPPADLVELDAERSPMDYRLCTSLSDLENKLEHRAAPARPVFAYTQSQDIHISVISREGKSVVDGGSYGSFYPPYASRLRRLDQCFGGFEQYLKSRNLFDNSVIVLTADHGDSLGEDGRWGHAYSLVPEVVRVPFIVHLPKSMQGIAAATADVAFQSDITPSLYAMLGHPPTLKESFYGRPLFGGGREKRDNHVIAASYASVWGLIGNSGKSLFVSDAVNYRDSYFEMDDRGSSEVFLGSGEKAAGQEEIRKGIAVINAFYKFQPH